MPEYYNKKVEELFHLPTLIDKLSSHEAVRIGVFGGKHVELIDKLAAFYNNQRQSDVVIVPLQDTGSASTNEALAKQQIDLLSLRIFHLCDCFCCSRFTSE